MSKVPVQNLYDAFFSLLESDEWELWEEEDIKMDLFQLAMAATPWFKFPRCSLEIEGNREYFADEAIGNTEIQILALRMKSMWYGRVIESWENLRPLYTERDFSPAAQQKQYNERQQEIIRQAKELEAIYYRSVNSKPFDYRKLAGGR